VPFGVRQRKPFPYMIATDVRVTRRAGSFAKVDRFGRALAARS
jgi:hypothetical protein